MGEFTITIGLQSSNRLFKEIACHGVVAGRYMNVLAAGASQIFVPGKIRPFSLGP
jgi:hypothetical protein